MATISKLFKYKFTVIMSIVLCVVLVAVGGFSIYTINAQNGRIDRLSKKVVSLEKSLNSKEDSIDKLKGELSEAETEIAEYEEELKKYRKLVATLQTLNQEQESLINELKTPLNGRDEKTLEPADTKIAYLTFDDGPSEHTEEILKILTEKDAVATFFVIGNKHIGKTDAIIKQGSAVAMHSLTHTYSKIYSSADAYFEDLYAIEAKIYENCGVKPKIMRLPGGASNTISKQYSKGVVTQITQRLKDEGYVYFDWNVDSTDASKNGVPVDTLLQKIKDGSKNKPVINILMHDTDAKKTTVEALPAMIDYLRSEGYQFMTLSPTSTVIQHAVNN